MPSKFDTKVEHLVNRYGRVRAVCQKIGRFSIFFGFFTMNDGAIIL